MSGGVLWSPRHGKFNPCGTSGVCILKVGVMENLTLLGCRLLGCQVLKVGDMGNLPPMGCMLLGCQVFVFWRSVTWEICPPWDVCFWCSYFEGLCRGKFEPPGMSGACALKVCAVGRQCTQNQNGSVCVAWLTWIHLFRLLYYLRLHHYSYNAFSLKMFCGKSPMLHGQNHG